MSLADEQNLKTAWPTIWLLCTILIGFFLTYNLARIDYWMYSHDAEFLNNKEYRENRSAWTSMPRENLDSRNKPLAASLSDG